MIQPLNNFLLMKHGGPECLTPESTRPRQIIRKPHEAAQD